MFQPIRRILPQSIRSAGLESSVSAVRVLEESKAVLDRLWGSEAAAFVTPISFMNGALHINVRSPSAAHALARSSVQWMNEINRAIGAKTVGSLRIRRIGF